MRRNNLTRTPPLLLAAALAVAAALTVDAASDPVFRVEKKKAEVTPRSGSAIASVKTKKPSPVVAAKRDSSSVKKRATKPSPVDTAASRSPQPPSARRDSTRADSALMLSGAARWDTLPTSAATSLTAGRDDPLLEPAADSVDGVDSVVVKAPRLDTIPPPLGPAVSRPATALKIPVRKVGVFVFSIAVIALTGLFLVRKRREGKRFMTGTRLSIMDKEVQRACRYIERAHANSSLTAEVVSRELVTGQSFLQALFMRELGMTVEEFIDQVRVNRVRGALKDDPSMDIEALARDAGFQTPAQLQQAFRGIVGVSIDEYVRTL